MCGRERAAPDREARIEQRVDRPVDEGPTGSPLPSWRFPLPDHALRSQVGDFLTRIPSSARTRRRVPQAGRPPGTRSTSPRFDRSRAAVPSPEGEPTSTTMRRATVLGWDNASSSARTGEMQTSSPSKRRIHSSAAYQGRSPGDPPHPLRRLPHRVLQFVEILPPRRVTTFSRTRLQSSQLTYPPSAHR